MRKIISVVVFILLIFNASPILSDPLSRSNLYTKIATNCKTLDLLTWSHPTRQILEKLKIKIEKVELCNNRKYPIFHVLMEISPYYHSGDSPTKKYFHALWQGIMNANGWNPLAFVDITGNQIIYVKKSTSVSVRGAVDIDYEDYSE